MERWKDIIGYEGYYQVSNIGNVRSLTRTITRSDGVSQTRVGSSCRVFFNRDGYPAVKLSRDGVTKIKPIHRVVYEAFVGEIRSGQEINHIDFNRTNNCVENLESVSHYENVRHTVKNGRHYAARGVSGEKNPNYGNRKLSEVYKNDKNLSKTKQGRPGIQNGRCKPVTVVSKDGSVMSFDYISKCAEYFIESGITTNKITTVSANISKCAKTNTLCYGYRVKI